MIGHVLRLLLLFIVETNVVHCQIRENDLCQNGTDKYGSNRNICLKINDCSSAVSSIRKGNALKICGRNENTTLVCCAPNESTANENSSSVSIINEACNRYKELQYEIEINESETTGDYRFPRVRTVANCFVPSDSFISPDTEKAENKEFPHMASIGYGESRNAATWLCGGSLISEKFILTAAHCANSYSYGDAKWVRLGGPELRTVGDSGNAVAEFTITERIVHPNFTSSSAYNDIALFRLDKSVTFNAYVRPICLTTNPELSAANAIATGWGVIESGYFASEHLRKLTLPLVPSKKCKELLGTDQLYIFGIDEESQICAGGTGGKDVCTGDSGGPLQLRLVNESCSYVQVGVTSFGGPLCNLQDFPTVFTRVYKYLNWIQNIVWPKQ